MPENQEKTFWKPGNMVMPAPAAMISCQASDGRPNIITVSWCGNINTNPPMLSISVRPTRLSYGILVESGEFVVNIPPVRLAWAVDYCGVVSGRDKDKFAECRLTPLSMPGVSCPGIAECPVHISCKITERHELGSHALFLATVIDIGVDAALVDKDGAFDPARSSLLCYAHGGYHALGRKVGHFGWSVRKKPAKARRKPKRRPN